MKGYQDNDSWVQEIMQGDANRMKEHHPSLSPSRFPALAQCIHYEPIPIDSESRKRGTLIHEYAAKILRDQPIGSVPMEQVNAVGCAEWIAKEVRRTLSEIRGIEYRVKIMDYMEVPPETITYGTADAWGYDGLGLALVDAKSGKERDYKEQMAVYALGLMDEQREEICRCIVLYCDSKTLDVYTFSLREAEQIVFGIISRVQAGVEEPQENDYCSFCAKRPTCPVWVIPAEEALAIASDKTFDLESLKQDPVKLGEFWDKWTKAKKLVDDAKLREAALEYLNADEKSIPGWEAKWVNGRLSYDEEEIEEILDLIPELGIERVRTFLKVDQKAFEDTWSKYSKEPVPVVPTMQAGAYQKLIRKK